jgi:ferredoxin-type protein NapH
VTRRWTRWRRAAQLASAAFFLALPFAGGGAVVGTAIALRAGALDLLEPASALSAWLAAGAVGAAALVATLPFVAVTALLGSVYCAWICPFGLLSEAIDALRGRRGRRWSGKPWLGARPLRLAALAVVLGASALLAVPLAGVLAPPRLVTAPLVEAVSARVVPAVSLALLGGLVALELLLPRRLLCRALCPVGGLSALLRARGWRPRWEATRCLCRDVPACLTQCPWGLDPREMKGLDGCTSCLACVERCPSGALDLVTPGRRAGA